MSNPRMTITTQLVLRALLATPGREMYGLEIIRGTGLPSGTIYPALYRLQTAGWISVRDERINPVHEGRPRRRYYQVTPDGATRAREAMAKARVQLTALGIE